jgi:hypothetical protein
VLVTLARTTRPLTGREVARLSARGSQAGINRALQRLREHGLVTVQEAGRAHLYALNRDHVAAPAVEALANLRAELLRRLTEQLKGWRPAPLHASVFGSLARGEGTPDSDVDLFLVRPASLAEDDPRWRAQLDRLSVQVGSWSGNRLSVAEVSSDELRGLRRRRPAIAAELRRDAIVMVGPTIAKLLGEVP